jgi:hypothetical protein
MSSCALYRPYPSPKRVGRISGSVPDCGGTSCGGRLDAKRAIMQRLSSFATHITQNPSLSASLTAQRTASQ